MGGGETLAGDAGHQRYGGELVPHKQLADRMALPDRLQGQKYTGEV
ncbi:hypothetical protein [Erwinia sp. ErVv1]|nr:hypothetical protein [Erwinia sp. ErVv1]